MDSDDLHAVAIEAATTGAKAIQAVGANDLIAQGKSGVEDYVTAADLASEQAIIEIIKMRRPRDTIVAEETGIHVGSSTIRWYVDPLDGTANILAGSADYAVSIAAEHGGQTVAAAIYLPHVADEHRVGSAACVLLQVATGQLDAYVSVDLPLWDTYSGWTSLLWSPLAVSFCGYAARLERLYVSPAEPR